MDVGSPVIAVVEDDPILLEVLHAVLTDAGYQTRLWRQGRGTYEQIAQLQPALVLLDVRLEDARAGWHLLQQLVQAPPTRHVPVIVTSADGEFLHAQHEHLQQWGLTVLDKPFDLNDLVALVDQWVRRGQRQTEEA